MTDLTPENQLRCLYEDAERAKVGEAVNFSLGRHVELLIKRVAAVELPATPSPMGEEALRAALLTVLNAVRDYLPPDGIDAQECLNRVIGAVDNPAINAIIREIEDVSAHEL